MRRLFLILALLCLARPVRAQHPAPVTMLPGSATIDFRTGLVCGPNGCLYTQWKTRPLIGVRTAHFPRPHRRPLLRRFGL